MEIYHHISQEISAIQMNESTIPQRGGVVIKPLVV